MLNSSDQQLSHKQLKHSISGTQIQHRRSKLYQRNCTRSRGKIHQTTTPTAPRALHSGNLRSSPFGTWSGCVPALLVDLEAQTTRRLRFRQPTVRSFGLRKRMYKIRCYKVLPKPLSYDTISSRGARYRLRLGSNWRPPRTSTEGIQAVP
jgi:hypothetical protein